MVLSYLHSFTGYLLRFPHASYGLISPHSFTGYILMFSRASYGLILSPLLHRISFKVSPCILWSYLTPFLYRISFNVFPCFLWSYLIPTPSPDILMFPVLIMIVPHPHAFTGYILMFSRASYGLISPPFLYRISFNVSSCFLWSYLISTPSPDIF